MIRRFLKSRANRFGRIVPSIQEAHLEQATDWQPFLGEIDKSKRFYGQSKPVEEERFELTATDWKTFIGEIDRSKQPITSLIDGMMPQIGLSKSQFHDAS